uniref:Uncharacterized protein n=1 Tax=Rhizophagus irregularis (strain DAOM 181602 / DAOM 197198 / MUCL 43194) TaxID=747089 RepID=U9U5E6_RHIID
MLRDSPRWSANIEVIKQRAMKEPGDGGIDLFGGLLGTIYFTFKRIINRIRHVYTRYL